MLNKVEGELASEKKKVAEAKKEMEEKIAEAGRLWWRSSKVQESADAGGNTRNNIEKATSAGDIKQDSDKLHTVKNEDGNDAKECEINFVATGCDESDSTTKTVPDASGMQIIDMTGGWKVVMHEKSNQCYYWNTVTGETSWEIPIHDELALGAGTSNEGNVSFAIEEKVYFNVPAYAHSDTQLAAYSNVLVADGDGDGHSIPKSTETYGSVEIGANGEVVHVAYDVNQGLTHYNSSLVGVSCEESSALSAFGSSQQSTVLLSEHMTDSGEDRPMSSDEDELLTRPGGCHEIVSVHSARLVKCGENLLRRLKAFEGSQNSLDGFQWIVKEIEVRISDCKALSSCGSSLLPFWWHTVSRLKQLESAVAKWESSCLVQSNTAAKWKLSKIRPGGKTIGMGSEKEAEVLLPKVDSHAEDMDMDVEMEVDEETVAGQTVTAYYAPVAGEVTSANYYAQADGSRIAEPQPLSYYESAVASAFPGVAADVNPTEPVSYYDLSSGADPHAPVVTSGASEFYIVSAPVGYHSLVAELDHAESVGFAMDSERTSLCQVKLASDISAVTSEVETASVQAASVASTVQAAGTASANGSATAAPSSAALKNLSKDQSP
ncbi:hypothetical protein COCNU_01G013390 [Cocos nucifera]|uniref:WW domain-containing protein n=1 Tax=Cocos nucifera TaxID=13894 RepID=A0A8K0HVP4_COCNU|nr:hypothetical protein COCNU_01G013390 [Cocos nucifera]